MKPKLKRLMWIAPLAVLGILVFIAIGGGIVMYLWNWLSPDLFGLRPVTFWQAVGILALCRILFGGFGMSGSSRSGIRRRMEERMAERCANMTPEEREQFRQGIRSRFDHGTSGDKSKEH